MMKNRNPCSRLTDLIAQAKAKDPQLGVDLEREFKLLSSRLPFGLNFERHRPEAVELPQRPIRKGDKVRVLPPRGTTKKGDLRLWQIKAIRKADEDRVADLELLGAAVPVTQTVALDNLVVVAEFRDIIYPGLVSTGKVQRGGVIDLGAPSSTLFELVEITAAVPGVDGPEPTESTNDDSDLDAEFEGNLSAAEYARVALPLLVAHVLAQRDEVLVPLTYRQLAELLNRRTKNGAPWGRGLGHVLGHVTTLVDAAGESLPERPPFLTSIVVLSTGINAGLPAKGVAGRWPGYEALSVDEKRAKVTAEHQRVLQFGSRWNEVLSLAGLVPLLPPVVPDGGSRSGGWGCGESDAHKALKRYVRENPELCGAQAGWFAQEEYALRSGDEVDVMFKSDDLWIGVEVKSRISDNLVSDYERGIYQVIKYRAVLQAQAQIDHPKNTPEVVVLLALESNLPAAYRGLAANLQVTCLECVGGVLAS